MFNICINYKKNIYKYICNNLGEQALLSANDIVGVIIVYFFII